MLLSGVLMLRYRNPVGENKIVGNKEDKKLSATTVPDKKNESLAVPFRFSVDALSTLPFLQKVPFQLRRHQFFGLASDKPGLLDIPDLFSLRGVNKEFKKIMDEYQPESDLQFMLSTQPDRFFKIMQNVFTNNRSSLALLKKFYPVLDSQIEIKQTFDKHGRSSKYFNLINNPLLLLECGDMDVPIIVSLSIKNLISFLCVAIDEKDVKIIKQLHSVMKEERGGGEKGHYKLRDLLATMMIHSKKFAQSMDRLFKQRCEYPEDESNRIFLLYLLRECFSSFNSAGRWFHPCPFNDTQRWLEFDLYVLEFAAAHYNMELILHYFFEVMPEHIWHYRSPLSVFEQVLEKLLQISVSDDAAQKFRGKVLHLFFDELFRYLSQKSTLVKMVDERETDESIRLILYATHDYDCGVLILKTLYTHYNRKLVDYALAKVPSVRSLIYELPRDASEIVLKALLIRFAKKHIEFDKLDNKSKALNHELGLQLVAELLISYVDFIYEKMEFKTHSLYAIFPELRGLLALKDFENKLEQIAKNADFSNLEYLFSIIQQFHHALISNNKKPFYNYCLQVFNYFFQGYRYQIDKASLVAALSGDAATFFRTLFPRRYDKADCKPVIAP